MPMIKMYTTSWCPDCHAAKRALQQKGLDYQEINIEEDEQAAEYVMSVNGGNQTVPTVQFADGTALTNPSLAQVLDKLSA